MSSPTYKDAGVNLDLYAQAMAKLPPLIASTRSDRVIDLPGGFAGLFRLAGEGKSYRDPVLVSGSDGVGTKIKLAGMTGVANTLGIDLVGMCVNDCLCLGAEPLFFLDYIALGKDDPELIAQLVEGVAHGCRQAGAALLGGETAIMPDVYAAGEFDMAGFCVGVVERDEIVDGKATQPGDVLIGLDSTGFHSNGYSLIRKVVFELAGLAADTPVTELNQTVGEILLTPTQIYVEALRAIWDSTVSRHNVHAIAHITGGGLAENLERVLPEGIRADIDAASWERPGCFRWLQRLGNIEPKEMWRVFNMGIGLVLAVTPDSVEAVLAAIATTGVNARVIGQISSGERHVEVSGRDC